MNSAILALLLMFSSHRSPEVRRQDDGLFHDGIPHVGYFIDGHKVKRSTYVRHQFQKLHPCPSTGNKTGPCAGYVVDHIVPLACGGADRPGNMQWQTVAEGKAKDKIERKNCRKN